MTDDLYTKIFVFGERERVERLLGQMLRSEQAHTLRGEAVEVEVRQNEDRDARRAEATYENFIYAPIYLDVVAASDASRAAVIESVSGILTALWDGGMLAVAAADFEDELPHRGGVALLKERQNGK